MMICLAELFVEIGKETAIVQDLPFKMQGGFRVDDTPLHRALQEAECLIFLTYGKTKSGKSLT